MGLDNGFIIKHNSTGISCDIAYFRKYYELDTWVRQNCKSKAEDIYAITEENIKDLQSYIKPIYDILIKIDDGLLNKFDDTVYNKSTVTKIEAVAYNNEFNPLSTQSSFAGHKLIHLYQSLCQMLEIIELDEHQDWSIEFYSSY